MNCDTAFDLLTDPQGAASVALESHLARCPRCRQMQETLAPALDWMQDAAGAEDRDDLIAAGRSPGDRAPAFATAEALEIAQQAAARLSTRRLSSAVRYQRWAIRLAACAALVFAGGLLGRAMVSGLPVNDGNPESSVCRRAEVATHTAGTRSPAQIQALVASCTACHLAERPLPPVDRRGTLRVLRGSPILALALLDCRYL